MDAVVVERTGDGGGTKEWDGVARRGIVRGSRKMIPLIVADLCIKREFDIISSILSYYHLNCSTVALHRSTYKKVQEHTRFYIK